MTVKRWDCYSFDDSGHECAALVREYSGGEFVLASDYDAKEAELAECQKRLAEAERDRDHTFAQWMKCCESRKFYMQNAERYRWLRDNCKRTLLMRLPASYAPADIDVLIDAARAADHKHTDECWEPDSGCDMGRNDAHIRVASPDETALIDAARAAGSAEEVPHE
jgi:hypothetical protein